MADVDLIYGPGAPTAVLVGNLRSLTFKHDLSLSLESREDELENALRLHFSAKAAEAIAAKLPKSLRMCFPVFSKRCADLTTDVDDARTVALRLDAPTSREAYKAVINAYCDLVASCFPATDEMPAAALAGASFENGVAHLEVDATGEGLAWQIP